ncbi:hypothetical protein HMPREF3291_04400 [Bacillus sp. HMSC76G11]|nr:hypothetical protein HMPREF3291_04400 [Bacillus sp. HMSC76G11]
MLTNGVLNKNGYLLTLTFTVLLMAFIATLLLSETYYYLIAIIIIACLGLTTLFIILKSNIINVLLLLIGVCLTFNIEFSIASTFREGGLPSSAVVNQYLIYSLIFFFFIFKGGIVHNKLFNQLLFLLVAMSGITLISLLFAENKIGAFYLLERHLFLLVLFVGIVRFSTVANYKYLIFGFSISIIFQLFISIIQNRTGQALGLYVLGESYEPFRKGVAAAEQGVSGTLGHPGSLGLFLVFAYPILMTYLIRSFVNKEWKTFLFLIVANLSLFVLVILTDARTSILLIIVSTILIMLFYYIRYLVKHRLKRSNFLSHYFIVMFLPIIIVFLLIIMIISQQERFLNSDFIRQFYDRMNISNFSWDYIITGSIKNFMIGVGPNNYVDYLKHFGQGEFLYEHPVHNYYLLIFSENGILYLISFLFFFFILLKKIVSMIKILESSYYHIYIGAIASTIVMLLYNFTGWSFSHNQIQYFIFIQLALVVSLIAEEDRLLGIKNMDVAKK